MYTCPQKNQIWSSGSWICVVMTSWWLFWLSRFHPKCHRNITVLLLCVNLTCITSFSQHRSAQVQFNYIVYAQRKAPENRSNTQTDGILDTRNLLYWQTGRAESRRWHHCGLGDDREQIERMQTCAWMNWHGNNAHGCGESLIHIHHTRSRLGFIMGFKYAHLQGG